MKWQNSTRLSPIYKPSTMINPWIFGIEIIHAYFQLL